MKKSAVLAIILTLAMPAITLASEVRVSLDPPTATLSTALTFSVTLEEDLPESAEVSITFPEQMRIQEKIADGLALFSSLPIAGIAVDGKTVTFATPEPQEQRRELSIFFPISAGFRNPFRAGVYQLQLSVGGESFSCPVTIEKILQDAPKVSIKPDKVGKTVGVTIQIPHPEGLVVAKDDLLDIVFPQEFIFPETVDLDSIYACKEKPTTVFADNNSIRLTFSKDVPPKEPLTIVIEPAFGIKSPHWPGNFSLIVGMPGKMEDTRSETFQIFPLQPTLSLAIDPPMPESGWFSSVPTVQIMSSAKRLVYFSWDSRPRQEYLEPLVPEPGIHVLSFVGRVEDGGWEAELSETFRIDIDEPRFEPIVSSANKENYTLSYRISDTSQCVSGVDDMQAKSTGFNRFDIELTLDAGSNDFVFWAEDVVGRRVEIPHKIILDKTPPALSVTTPAQTSVVCGREVTVTGKTEPDAKVRINGNEVIPNGKGSFIGVIKPVDEGPTDIVVEATDPAGNTNTVKVPILYIRSTKIIMKLGSTQAQIAGKTKEIEAAPYEKFGAMFIPISNVSGWLGYKISTKDKKTFTLEDKQKTKISFTLESNVVTIEGKQGSYAKNLEMNPEITDGAICVPVEFIDKGFGLETQIDTNTITILFCPKG